MLHTSEIEEKLKLLDGRGTDSEYAAVNKLSSLGDKFPELMLQKYRCSKKWGERASCVYHSIKYAKSSHYAFQLGIEALRDKSKHVRYRACMLLAIAQNHEAVGHLEQVLNNSDSINDVKAAIDAITNNNHHLFVDREHTGKIKLNVELINS
ncbi:hypothetical protein ACMZOO_00925 [Catenovulum sp. SX2]|uniref:hypothetical protein n=1 Tax=Catenovulum sp. SX2 TaxID=3398614 RepID=UPI003F85B035